MGILLAVLAPLGAVNEVALKIGRGIGACAVALMVVAILIQVFFRYVLNNALPWPDEAARFCMLWMAGLMAPTAFRRGGFVAIDMVPRALPRVPSLLLGLVLLLLSLMVLYWGLTIGWREVTGFAGSFKTASLWTFFSIEFANGVPWFEVDWGLQKMPRSHMMASLVVGVVLLISVNVELILRAVIALLGGEDRLPAIPDADNVGAE